MRRFLQVTAIAVLSIFLTGAGEYDQARYRTLGNSMMCMCGCNQVLAQCNHVGCSYSTKMLAELRQRLANGETDEQIYAAFVAGYGPPVLAAPTKEGFNRVAWIMPYLVFALSLIFAGVVAWAWRRRPERPVVAHPQTLPSFDSFREQARKETDL